MNEFEKELGTMITPDMKWLRKSKSKMKDSGINGFERIIIQTYIEMAEEQGKVPSSLEAEAMYVVCYGGRNN
jgi:hypothetical protein